MPANSSSTINREHVSECKSGNKIKSITRKLEKKIRYNELEEWIKNYSNNPGLPIITKSALIHRESFLTSLNTITEQYKAQKGGKEPDGFRIYFIRYSKKDIEGTFKEGKYEYAKDKDLTQLSLVFVPTTNYGETIDEKSGGFKVCADDFVLDKTGDDATDVSRTDDEIICLPIGHAENIGEGTGLCPPNCGGSFENR